MNGRTDDPYVRSVRTHAQARAVALQAASVCADAWRVTEALMELLANAIEHGNLGIGHAHKRALIDSGRWEDELERLQRLPVHAGRSVRLTREALPGGWRFTVEDEGEGFDWAAWHARTRDSSAPCGRGLALARTLGGVEPEFLGRGNRVRFLVPFG